MKTALAAAGTAEAPAVPILDLRRYGDGAAAEAFVGEFGRAFEETGFCGIIHHGIDPDLVESCFSAFEAFFALPEAERLRCHLPGSGGARGYTPYRRETAKGATRPDLKAFFHIGREPAAGTAATVTMKANVWPARLPALRPASLALYAALDALGRRLLSALSRHIGLPADFFDGKVDRGNSILRAIHYPPLPETAEAEGAVRSGAHEDINLITLMLAPSAGGLELRLRDGRWLPLAAPREAVVVNIGDMLQRLTNHRYRSTTHRVVNPTGAAARRSRYSMPFFLHPNPEVSLAALPCCVTPQRPHLDAGDITADEYLRQRLREIRLL